MKREQTWHDARALRTVPVCGAKCERALFLSWQKEVFRPADWAGGRAPRRAARLVSNAFLNSLRNLGCCRKALASCGHISHSPCPREGSGAVVRTRHLPKTSEGTRAPLCAVPRLVYFVFVCPFLLIYDPFKLSVASIVRRWSMREGVCPVGEREGTASNYNRNRLKMEASMKGD